MLWLNNSSSNLLSNELNSFKALIEIKWNGEGK